MKMELRKATHKDYMTVWYAVRPKKIKYCTANMITNDYLCDRLFVVREGGKVIATVSLVPETEYGYTAIKRLCILNKRNCGRGVASFAVRELQKVVRGKCGATPWSDNIAMRKLLESEGFTLQYIFDGRWCFYAKD